MGEQVVQEQRTVQGGVSGHRLYMGEQVVQEQRA